MLNVLIVLIVCLVLVVVLPVLSSLLTSEAVKATAVLNDVVVVVRNEEASTIDESLNIIDTIELLSAQAIEDLSKAVVNNEYDELGFRLEAMKIEFPLEEAFIKLTLGTVFYSYAKEQLEEVELHISRLKGCIANNVASLSTDIDEVIEAFECDAKELSFEEFVNFNQRLVNEFGMLSNDICRYISMKMDKIRLSINY